MDPRDSREVDHGGRLRVRTIHEAVDVLNLQEGGAWATREHGHAAFESHVGLGHAAKEGFYEFVDLLAGATPSPKPAPPRIRADLSDTDARLDWRTPLFATMP